MKRILRLRLMLMALLVTAVWGASFGAASPEKVSWHEGKEFTVEGRGWGETDSFYNRFPSKAKKTICGFNEHLWYLSEESSGMLIRFKSDASSIHVKWDLMSDNLSMPHMASTGVSGVDLYVRYNGGWRWLGNGQPHSKSNEATLVGGLSKEEREYQLYLPLYNGITSVQIGVPEGSLIAPLPRTPGTKPVVFYGTSITQGACASRPGMNYPAIVGRRLDVPIVDLGFSGSGRCEPEVADLLTDIDAEVFVIDCLPNMDLDKTSDRVRYLLKGLHEKHPGMPVVLVDNVVPGVSYIYGGTTAGESFNKVMKKIYDDNKAEWNEKLFYAKATKMLGNDGEATVDGIHPTDLGLTRMADVIAPVVKKALRAAERP